MHELFDHTADVGIRATAATLDELFSEAAKGLFSVIVENPADGQPTETREFQLEEADTAFLLFDWLNELLYVFESEHLILSRFECRLQDDKLTATAHGEPLDEQRHRLGNEVKAITYHELKVQQRDSDWLAEIIVDI
ncbi:MAG: archease [Planctomycetales bacterium]